MIKEVINDYLKENVWKLDIIKIWYIKEIFQSYILSYIYDNKKYKDLVFYGGTATRFLFNLNRLSEDLDFIWENFSDFENLAKDLKLFFKKNYDLDLEYKIQKFRITLKFRDFLKNYNLSYWTSSDLYIKIEISKNFKFCEEYGIKNYPIFRFWKSIVIRSLDSESLFATKINAVLYRKWIKEIGNTKIIMKWRDIYDLFWYLSNSFKMNISCVDWISNKRELILKLTKIIKNIDFKNISLDVENFIEDKNIMGFFKSWWKEYILENLENISD